MIAFIIYGEPKGKGRPRFFHRGRFTGTYTPANTKQAEASILAQALSFRPVEPIDSAIVVTLAFYMPIPKSRPKKWRESAEKEETPHTKKPDLDNLIKCVLDPMNSVFWNDDSQIFRVTASKFYGKVPRTEVVLEWMTINGCSGALKQAKRG